MTTEHSFILKRDKLFHVTLRLRRDPKRQVNKQIACLGRLKPIIPAVYLIHISRSEEIGWDHAD